MHRGRLRWPAPGDLTLHAGARVEIDVRGRRLRVEGESPAGPGNRDVEAGHTGGIGDVGALRVGGEDESGSAAIDPAGSSVGHPVSSAAFHRARSSAVSPAWSTWATAPTDRSAPVPVSDSCTTGTRPTGLPVESVTRTSRRYPPATVGAAPPDVSHTISRRTPPTACWRSATAAIRCAIS